MMFDLIASSPVFAILAEGAAKPLDTRIDLLLFTVVIFLVLLFVLRKYAWNPIVQGLEKREKGIATQIDDAQRAHEKAQATLAQYEQKLAAAAEEASEVLAEAKREAQAAKDRIVAEANAEAQRQRERAIADIHAAKDQAVRELAERSVDSAVTLASNLVGKELDKAAHSKLIEDSLSRFSQQSGA